ncbi:MAG: hypothetical protein K0Q71_6062 [Thermomicrobiales bacterium]|nr:hypothetical protein [Thermomicrobiales bacterium]
MAAPLDLYRASREELVVLVVRQRARIADLEREQARLQAELTARQAAVAQLQERVGGAAGTAGDARRRGEPDSADDDAGAEAGWARWRHRTGAAGAETAGARLRTAAHAPDGAPGACLRPVSALRDGAGRRHDPAHARGYRGGSGPCRGHGTRLRGAALSPLSGAVAAGPEVDGLVVGQGRLAVGLLSLITTLREEPRLPIRGIQW